MPRKPSKELELMETLGQMVLNRDWACIHGISMQAPCGSCLATVKHEIETQRLQVAEAIEENENG